MKAYVTDQNTYVYFVDMLYCNISKHMFYQAVPCHLYNSVICIHLRVYFVVSIYLYVQFLFESKSNSEETKKILHRAT